MKTFQFSFVAAVTVIGAAFLSGCGSADELKPAPGPSTPADQAAQPAETPAHSHGAGPNGGALADWGGGKFHVEFTVDHDKKESVVYVLGGDEKTPAPVKADKLLLSIKDPEFQVELAADPLDGEAEGMSSRFVGTHDNLGIVQEFAGSISGEVDGTPYVGEFKEEPPTEE